MNRYQLRNHECTVRINRGKNVIKNQGLNQLMIGLHVYIFYDVLNEGILFR